MGRFLGFKKKHSSTYSHHPGAGRGVPPPTQSMEAFEEVDLQNLIFKYHGYTTISWRIRAVATINKPVRPLVGARVGDHEGFNKL